MFLVEIDPVMWAVIVGILGLALWIGTNLHLVRTGRAIKADIDEKRASTEEFVREELARLETNLNVEMPDFDAFKAEIHEELSGLESRLATVQIDVSPILEQVQAELIPAVQEKVENIKSTILGKLGYGTKALKAAAEGVVEVVGERAAEEAGFDAEWQLRLARYGLDEEWLKAHKTAAVGFDIIREVLRSGQPVQITGGVPPGARQVGPGPKAPYGGI